MSSGPDFEKAPFPHRVIDDVGDAFSFGIAAGGAYHFVRGLYTSPVGARLAGGAQAALTNAPCVAGRFAFWYGLLSACDGSLAVLRGKDDLWNLVISGAVTRSLFKLRAGPGPGPAMRGALSGAALLGLYGYAYLYFEREAERANTRSTPRIRVPERFDSSSAPIPYFDNVEQDNNQDGETVSSPFPF